MGFTTSAWDEEGIATLEATGSNVRSAFEAGLRAALALTTSVLPARFDSARSALLRGEGDDLGALFSAMLDDLLAQLEEFGAGVDDVVIDGLLRRDDGGYVAWGRALGTLEAAPLREPPTLLGTPIVREEGGGVTVRARLRR